MAGTRPIPVLGALLVLSCSGGGQVGDARVESEDPADGEVPADVTGEDVIAEEVPPPPPCIEREDACLDSACHAPPFEITCLGGWIEDEAGDPIPDQGIVSCVDGVCYLSEIHEDGWFVTNLPGTPTDYVKLSFPGTEPRLRPFCQFDVLCDGAVSACHRFVLMAGPTSGIAVPEGTLGEALSIEASDTGALVLPAGSEIETPPEAERWMALTRYPLSGHVPCFLDPESLPLALYAVTPLATYVLEPGTTTSMPAALDLPNETGLAADADVDVYALGGTYLEHVDLEEGEWRMMASARVSTDGTRIRTLPGDGIAYLTWIGIYSR